jgi:hypothetical protein
MDWQFRVSHYGLFLRFGFIFPLFSTTFLGVIYLVVFRVTIATGFRGGEFPRTQLEDALNHRSFESFLKHIQVYEAAPEEIIFKCNKHSLD